MTIWNKKYNNWYDTNKCNCFDCSGECNVELTVKSFSELKEVKNFGERMVATGYIAYWSDKDGHLSELIPWITFDNITTYPVIGVKYSKENSDCFLKVIGRKDENGKIFADEYEFISA